MLFRSLQGFFKLHQAFLHVVSFYSLAFHAFMLLKPRFWVFFFKDLWFLKLLRYCFNFGLVFEDLILKTSCIALQLHYNKYYHAFRCVQSFCVLVGFDWAEPMMYLLCMSHVHAFSHAYVLYFSIYLLFELFWSFYDCLFLSPLYFVHVSSFFGT